MCMKTECKCEPKVVGHVHAEAMAEYAKDAAKMPNPWTLWENSHNDGRSWYTGTSHPRWWENKLYRRKKLTHVVNGYTVPAPLNAGNYGRIYSPNPSLAVWYDEWTSSTNINRLIERKMAFATREDAIANAKAMCGIDPSAP